MSRVKAIWKGRGKRSLAVDRQGPEAERAKHKRIGPVGGRGKYIQPELNHIASTIKRVKPKKILDVGTGYGMMWLWLTQCGLMPELDYTACDWIDEYRDFHNETTGVRPVKWDGITLPFDDEAFDFVMSYSVLLHVPPEDLIRVFREMVRVSSQWLYVHTARPMKKSGVADFDHDYYGLYKALGVQIVDELESADGKRVNWLLRKGAEDDKGPG